MISSKSARFLLFITAAIWGLAFVAQRAGMNHMGPMVFNTIRFGLGSIILYPIFRKHLKTVKQSTLYTSLLIDENILPVLDESEETTDCLGEE